MDKKMVVETTIHNCSCHKQLTQANARIAELEEENSKLMFQNSGLMGMIKVPFQVYKKDELTDKKKLEFIISILGDLIQETFGKEARQQTDKGE